MILKPRKGSLDILQEGISFDFGNIGSPSKKTKTSMSSGEDVHAEPLDPRTPKGYSLRSVEMNEFYKDSLIKGIQKIVSNCNLDLEKAEIGFDQIGPFINYNGDLYLHGMNLSMIPVRIKTLVGNCYISNNKFKDMSSFPRFLHGNLYCQLNFLKDFTGAPEVFGIIVGTPQKVKSKVKINTENYQAWKNSKGSHLEENLVYIPKMKQLGWIQSINESDKSAVVELKKGFLEEFLLKDIHIIYGNELIDLL